MLELSSAGRPVQLSPGTSLQIEKHSPLFDEAIVQGSFAYAFNVPAPPNGAVYGHPERPDGDAEPGAVLPAELSLEGYPLLLGTQRLKSASATKYSVSVTGGLSSAALSGRQLASFEYGGLREVPRWVPWSLDNQISIPGLVVHANAVVASPAAYPYVFAPFRNEYADPDGPPNPDVLVFPPQTVNPWLVHPADIYGIAAGGSFTYNLSYHFPGIPYPPDNVGVLYPCCPFPYLRYVLQCICEESGLAVDAAQLLPGELGALVFVGNAQLVDRGDANTLRFHLADVLPALSVAELLAALRQDLGVIVYVDPLTNQVRSGYLVERVATDAAYVELSAWLAGAPEVSLSEPAGLTLTSGVDPSDELTKDALSQQPDLSLLLPAVATVADLPATASILADNPQDGQVRLVRELETYYVCELEALDYATMGLNWTPLAPVLPRVEVNGGGQEQAQTICYTTTRPTRLRLDLQNSTRIPVPAISELPFRAGQQGERSPALRLLFYRGLRGASDGLSPWPELSHQSPSGQYSLRLSGQQGTYVQWLRAWLPVKLRGASYKQALQLPAPDLAGLDLTWPVQFDGVRFLVRKLSATVPLRRPAVVELVRL